jgi:hypothetical protein
VDEMPEGWIVMPAMPTPVHWGIPICNGKSILSGQREKALLRITAMCSADELAQNLIKVETYGYRKT